MHVGPRPAERRRPALRGATDRIRRRPHGGAAATTSPLRTEQRHRAIHWSPLNTEQRTRVPVTRHWSANIHSTVPHRARNPRPLLVTGRHISTPHRAGDPRAGHRSLVSCLHSTQSRGTACRPPVTGLPSPLHTEQRTRVPGTGHWSAHLHICPKSQNECSGRYAARQGARKTDECLSKAREEFSYDGRMVHHDTTFAKSLQGA